MAINRPGINKKRNGLCYSFTIQITQFHIPILNIEIFHIFQSVTPFETAFATASRFKSNTTRECPFFSKLFAMWPPCYKVHMYG